MTTGHAVWYDTRKAIAERTCDDGRSQQKVQDTKGTYPMDEISHLKEPPKRRRNNKVQGGKDD